MDFDHLTTFLEISKLGSFSRAGQKLFRSQPAVSAQIRQLEQEYGQKLFDRVGKTVKLTAAGEALIVYANRLLNLKEESLRAVSDLSSSPRGTRRPTITTERQASRCSSPVKRCFKVTASPSNAARSCRVLTGICRLASARCTSGSSFVMMVQAEA